MSTIHTRQLQQYTQDNYKNTHKTTTTIHTRQLQKYTQDNYKNTHKTTRTIRTRQLTTIHTRQLTTIHTRHLKIQHVGKVNNTKVRKYCIYNQTNAAVLCFGSPTGLIVSGVGVVLIFLSPSRQLNDIIIHLYEDHFLPYSFQFITVIFILWPCSLTPAMASKFMRFLDHTQRRVSVVSTPLDGWSARRRDLYLTTHNNHNRQTYTTWSDN